MGRKKINHKVCFSTCIGSYTAFHQLPGLARVNFSIIMGNMGVVFGDQEVSLGCCLPICLLFSRNSTEDTHRRNWLLYQAGRLMARDAAAISQYFIYPVIQEKSSAQTTFQTTFCRAITGIFCRAAMTPLIRFPLAI